MTKEKHFIEYSFDELEQVINLNDETTIRKIRELEKTRVINFETNNNQLKIFKLVPNRLSKKQIKENVNDIEVFYHTMIKKQ